jgi:signal transduction histidine kinase
VTTSRARRLTPTDVRDETHVRKRPPAPAALVIDADERRSEQLGRLLASADPPYRVEHAVRLTEALSKVARGPEAPIGVVFIDVDPRTGFALSAVSELCDSSASIPIVALVSPDGEGAGLEALQRGAQDFVVRSALSASQLARCIRCAIERQELALKQQERLLGRIQAERMSAMSRLAGSLAHDFNNLLTVIGSFATFVKDALPADATAQSDILEVLKAADRATGITRQLLAFSRRQVVSPRLVDFSEYITTLRPKLEALVARGVSLAFGVTADCWRTRVDPARLEEVLMQLVQNASQAMPAGGRITIAADNVLLEDDPGAVSGMDFRPGEYLEIAISDTGAGIAAETQMRIFEPFFTNRAKGRGSGLGLSTVFGIVGQAGGFLLLESAPGAGTTVRLYLPRAPQDQRAAAPLRSQSPPLHGTETILVVGIDRPARRLVSRTLRRYGYTVLQAGTSDAALAVLGDARQPVDLVFLCAPDQDEADRENIAEVERQLGTRHPKLKLVRAPARAASAAKETSEDDGNVDDAVSAVRSALDAN